MEEEFMGLQASYAGTARVVVIADGR